MKNILSFFTTNTGSNNFITFGPLHLFILFIALVTSIFIYIKKNKSKKFELLIGIILIIQQICLYSWYFAGKFNTFKEGLPLYHCRVAIIFVGIGLAFNKGTFMKIGAYWGIFGSISALLFPYIDPFAFPHITQFSFFIGHLFLLWGSVYILSVKKIGMSKSDFKITLIFTNIYHLSMFVINNIIGSNYGYMSLPPINIDIHFNPIFYGLLVIMMFNIVLFIEYTLINKIKCIKVSRNHSILQESL